MGIAWFIYKMLTFYRRMERRYSSTSSNKTNDNDISWKKVLLLFGRYFTFINPVWDSVDNCICYRFTGTNWKNVFFITFSNIWDVINGVIFYKNDCWARVWGLGWAWKPCRILQSWWLKGWKVIIIYILSWNFPCLPEYEIIESIEVQLGKVSPFI